MLTNYNHGCACSVNREYVAGDFAGSGHAFPCQAHAVMPHEKHAVFHRLLFDFNRPRASGKHALNSVGHQQKLKYADSTAESRV